MNFDKNTVIGIALIILIFLGFSIYTSQQEAKYLKEHPKKAETTAVYPTADSNKVAAKADSLVSGYR
jgi:hypothetical protein